MAAQAPTENLQVTESDGIEKCTGHTELTELREEGAIDAGVCSARDTISSSTEIEAECLEEHVTKEKLNVGGNEQQAAHEMEKGNTEEEGQSSADEPDKLKLLASIKSQFKCLKGESDQDECTMPIAAQQISPANLSTSGETHVHTLSETTGKDQSLSPEQRLEEEAGPTFSYNMQNKRRGVFIIINNKTFTLKGVSERTGTDEDAENLENVFSSLGFQVRRYNNKTCRAMLGIFQKAADEDHTDADCFGCAVLSHGDEGIIFGTDWIINVDALLEPIKMSGSLVGKPKLFFIQACRGTKLDEGVDVADGDVADGKPQRIPRQADCLYAFSTTPGHYSWRNKVAGSWFVQALCHVLRRYGTKYELMRLMTHVNYRVAHEFESSGNDAALNGKKQIPAIVSQLTKELHFTPKMSQEADVNSSCTSTEIRPSYQQPEKGAPYAISGSGRCSPRPAFASGSSGLRNQQSSALGQQSSRHCERREDPYTSQVVRRSFPAPVSSYTPSVIASTPTLV